MVDIVIILIFELFRKFLEEEVPFIVLESLGNLPFEVDIRNYLFFKISRDRVFIRHPLEDTSSFLLNLRGSSYAHNDSPNKIDVIYQNN